MSGFSGCYDYGPASYNTCGSPSHSDYKGSWLLPVLLILAAFFFCGGLSWILILLGIILLFGKELFNFII
ncbi:hypothetical protein [Cellulosilyticum sp. I15G10I2]|uniref:hypothetical protein n=1 Tax=Cellulosilyticum sp. I15G10I2 TaxID=1892843 RepID=UPI00085BE808|nr:hypothetical protein [Cellulosilyticum sp. I15G10I2]